MGSNEAARSPKQPHPSPLQSLLTPLSETIPPFQIGQHTRLSWLMMLRRFWTLT